MCAVVGPAGGVEVDEGVADEDVGGVHAVFDGEGVDGLAGAEQGELGAGLEDEGVGVGVGVGVELGEDGEGGGGVRGVGVGPDEGVDGEDVGVGVDMGEDAGGVGEDGSGVRGGEGDEGEDEVLGEGGIGDGDEGADGVGVDLLCAAEGG